MKCASCDVYIEPSYMPCPQCKRRAGYTLIEDTSRCAEIYDQAYTIVQADALANSSVLPVRAAALVEKNWWAAASEGSLSAREMEGLSQICDEMNIDRLIALIPDENKLGLAFVETSEDALRNFSWDFPSSFALFPPEMQFFLCQYEHPAVLVAGPKLLVERVFNASIEETVERFKEEMFDSGAVTLSTLLVENIIEPANNSAAK